MFHLLSLRWPDVAGLVGVILILAAYAAATTGRLHPKGALSLAANLGGASLILLSLLAGRFNLSAAIVEGAWALIALAGLLRLAFRRTGPQ
jgi:hypothetical protein